MGLIFLLAFILVPLAEIGLFVSVGGAIGLWPTLFIVIITALLGTALLRAQGFATLTRAMTAMNRGEAPVAEAFDGICLVFAGALLLTPGFLTDSVGFLLFIPPLRSALFNSLATRLRNSPNVHFQANFAQPRRAEPSRRPKPGGVTIDGEYHKVDEDAPQLDEPSDGSKPSDDYH